MNLSLTSVVLLLVLVLVLAALALLYAGLSARKIRHTIQPLYGVADEQFIRTMGVLLGPALVEGNRVETLLNGVEIFPAMLAAIRSAQKTIAFESYIYWSGSIGKEFADALSERARHGVKVHVLLDWVGSQKVDPAYLEFMREAGVEIEQYHPLRWYAMGKLNNRTHRKLLVTDGLVGFTGGVGIADEWSGNAEDPDHWRDTHYRVEGPVVAQMQAAFTDNWTKVTGRVLHGTEYFPPMTRAGSHFGQVFKSSTDGGSESMQLMYLLSIAAAQHSIRLSMAYFVPDKLALAALVDAVKRGVTLQIILPGVHTDASIVRTASRSTWGELLQAGGEIFEYQPTMFHCKVLIVDGLWVSVGSTNFDSRSFRLNDEANLNIYDRDFATRQVADFAHDLTRSRRISYEEWRRRPLWEKAKERFVALFNAQF